MDWDQLMNEVEDPTKTKKTNWDALFNSTPEIKPQKTPINTDLPPTPQWADVIVPAKQNAETAEGVGEFITAGAAKFDKALAGMFNQLDYVQTSLGDAVNTILVGKETANEVKKLRNKYGITTGDPSSINSIRPFNAVAKAIDWAASGAKELPNTMLGDIVGGIGSIGPEIIAAAVAPEIKTAKFLSDMGIKFASKFGTVMAAEGFVGGMQNAEGTGTVKSLTTPFISGVEQYMTGWMYDNMGAISSELGGKLAEKLIPEVKTIAKAKSQALIHSLGTTVSNALMFGGYGTAVEFLEKGESSWKTLGTGIGMGIGMGAREVGKSVWSKGINSFIASDRETIKRVAESDVSSEELITHAQEKIKAVENKTSKNQEGDVTSALLSNNAAILRGFIEEIKDNPEKVVQSVEQSTMPQELKTHIIDKIQQVSADIDPLNTAAKPYAKQMEDLDKQIDLIKTNPNYSPEVKELKIGSMAEKRGKIAIKVQEVAKELKQATDEKKTENLKQARIAEAKAAQVFPQFNEQLTSIADEVGATVETRLKAPQRTADKAGEKNVEVGTVGDIIGGRIIVNSFKDFAPLTKRLKEVYPDAKISNKRNLSKEGDIGVRVKLTLDGVGTEIQIETKGTAEARKESEAIRDKYRKEGIPEPDVADVETNKANYKPEDQIKAHEEFGGSTFSVGGQNLAGLKGKASVSVFPDRTEIIKPASKETTEQSTFPEDYVPEVQKRKSGKDKVSVTDKEGNEISSITFKTSNLFGDKYWVIQQAATATGNEGKGMATNVYKYAMENLPEGYKGIISPAESRQNQTQIPKIHEKLKKIYDTETQENGDIIFRPRTPGGVTPEVVKNFIAKNEDILNKEPGVFSIGTWKNEKGETELDVVATPNTNRAIELGKKYNQKSVFDLGKMEEIPTGGTGSGEEFKKVPIEDRIADALETPRTRYEAEMDQSKKILSEAYKGMEEVNLLGSPAITAQKKKMKELGIPISQQKELNKAWTVTKNKLLGELKDKNIETKEAFKDFIKNMPPISGLNIKLQKRMLGKVNSIDFTKPSSLPKAIEYFDKIVNNATWRFNEAKAEQALDILDKKSSEESLTKKAPNQPAKNIKGPTGLPLWDEIKEIRSDMLTKDWERGQEAIQDMLEIYTKEGRELGAEEFNHITRLNFWGALNSTNKGDHRYLTGAARDLLDIRKNGTSKAAAERMIKKSQDVETAKFQLNSILGNGRKSVELDNRLTQNQKDPFLKQVKALFDWPMSSSFFSHLEFLSQYDKTSKPYAGILHESLGDPQWYANRQTFTDRRDLFNEINAKAAEIFGTPEGRKLQKDAKDRTSTVHIVKYKDIAGVEKELPITMNQAIKVYMELQDPTLEASHEAGYYKRNGELTDLGQGVVNLLTPEAKAWGDWQLNEFYPKLYEILNPVYRQFYGRDMPFSDTYSPIFIEGADKKAVTNDDLLSKQSFVSGLKNGSLLSRVKHAKVLRLMDADQVLMSYVHNMTYWKNYTEPIQLLNSFVHNPEIRSAIKQNFTNGDTHLNVLQKDVNDLLNRPTDAWMTAGVLRKIRNNILIASLALKIPVGIKQISSAPAFAEYIPMKEIPKYTIESLVHWFGDKGNIALAKRLWNDAYLQQRYGQGWDNVLTEIMATDYHSVGNKSNWRSKTMFPIIGGDAASVFAGGIPVYRYAYDQAMKTYGPGSEKLAEAVALHTFSRSVDDTQQSGLSFNLSQVQTANDFFKTMTMYKSAPMQYHRKVSAALRNLFTGRGTPQQNLKTIAIYHVIMPALFQFMANGFKWDTKDEVQAGVMGNINNLFVAGDIIEGLINTARGEPWKKYRVSPILSTYDDAEAVVTHLPKVHVSEKRMIEGIPEEYIPQVLAVAKDYKWNMLELGKTIKYASKVIGAGLGLPVPGVTAIGQGILDVATGKEEGKSILYKAQRIMGTSDYTLQNGVDDSTLTPEEIDKLIETETKPPEKKLPGPVKKRGNIPNF
jgi:hypothetical protein